MYNGHMVFVKIWSHIFIYSKWTNLQLGDDTERDIIFFSFSGTTQKTHGISWLQIQIKVWSWLLGDSSSFWDQPSPLEVFLDVAVAQNDLNKWSPQCSDRSSLPWTIQAFFAQLVDFGASSICDRYKGRDSEGSHCQGKARSGSWLFKSRTSPTGKGRKGQQAAEEGWSRQTKQEEGSASSQTPNKAIRQMTVRKPEANALLSSSQRRAAVLSLLPARRTRMAPYERMKPLIAWQMFAAHSTILCKPQWL